MTATAFHPPMEIPEGSYLLDRPIRFEGTPEQREANYRTHLWLSYGDPEDAEIYCDCGSKPWHAAAEYPCGVEPPRETVLVTP